MADMPWGPNAHLLSDFRFWTILYLFIEIPLCLLRSLRSISFASLGSVIVMVLCCIVIIIYGAMNWGFSWDNAFWKVDNAIDVGKCFGLLSFGLAVNCLVPSSYVSMMHPERISPIVSISIIFALSLYVAMGLLGLLTFNKVEGGIDVFIMRNIPHQSPFYYTSSAVLCVMLILITPIIVYPSSLTIDAWFTTGCGNGDDALLENEVVHTPEAEQAPQNPQTAQENTQEQAGETVAVAMEKAQELKQATDHRTGVFITDFPGVAARVLPLLIMTVLAYFWPRFGNVVSITGASATSFVNFIFPTMIHFKLFRKEQRCWAAVDIILTVFGVFAAVVGTYMSMF
ncbi:hypothetical protein WA556_005749 [Blastocystis sp. ATCC 50177/Nand II]